jgi:hypothetical protein
VNASPGIVRVEAAITRAKVQTPMPVYTACSMADPNCKPPAAPTPDPLDATVLSILARDDFVRWLVGDGELWRDYWLNMSGDVAVDILFARPVSFRGIVPTRSDPCSGHAGADERVDPDDPCRKETPVYGTSYMEFHDQRWVQVFVEVDRNSVVGVFVPGSLDSTIDEFIAYLTENRPAIATAPPTP